MRGLSAFLEEQVVRPLNEAGVAVDLRDVQLCLVALPIAVVVLAFLRASWKKKQQMRDAGF